MYSNRLLLPLATDESLTNHIDNHVIGATQRRQYRCNSKKEYKTGQSTLPLGYLLFGLI